MEGRGNDWREREFGEVAQQEADEQPEVDGRHHLNMLARKQQVDDRGELCDRHQQKERDQRRVPDDRRRIRLVRADVRGDRPRAGHRINDPNHKQQHDRTFLPGRLPARRDFHKLRGLADIPVNRPEAATLIHPSMSLTQSGFVVCTDLIPVQDPAFYAEVGKNLRSYLVSIRSESCRSRCRAPWSTRTGTRKR